MVQLGEHLVAAKLGEQVDIEVGDQGRLLVGQGQHRLEGLLCPDRGQDLLRGGRWMFGSVARTSVSQAMAATWSAVSRNSLDCLSRNITPLVNLHTLAEKGAQTASW